MDKLPNKDNKEIVNNKSFSFLSKDKDKDKDKSNSFFGAKRFLGTKEIKEGHEEIRNMASIALSPKDEIRNSRVENFQTAMARMNTSYGDLPLIYRNYSISFYILLLGAVISFFYGIYFGLIGQGILSMFACISVSILCLSHCFRLSFRCFQIKNQKLCSVKDFISYKEFFPTKIN